MANCRYVYKGKTYSEEEFARLLGGLHPSEASKVIPGIKNIPEFPFEKTWHEFVLKRIIRMAAEQGYDKVAWTTGEQQAERYDLSKQIKALEYIKRDGKYEISIDLNNGDQQHAGTHSESELEGVVGKEVAQKIIAGEGKKYRGHEGRTLEGLALKVGGEGMKGFYDKILVDFANKFGKKFGAKVVNSEIVTREEVEGKFIVTSGGIDGGVLDFRSQDDAIDFARRLKSRGYNDAEISTGVIEGQKERVHSLDITPKLKQEALQQGFSLFQKDKDVLGKFSITQEGLTIELSDKANLSTFIHETGHLYLHEMGKDLATIQAIPEDQRTDIQKKFLEDTNAVLGFLGVGSFAEIKTEHHEKWARAFEAYHMEGKAPTAALRKAFATFRAWLINIYRQIKALDVELSDEVRGVMDRMIATKEEIDAASQESRIEPMVADPRKAGMSEKESAAYEKLLVEVKNKGEEILSDKMVKEMQREQRAWWNEERKKVLDEVTKEVDQEQDQIAFALLTKGKKPDGSALPINLTGGFGKGNVKAVKISMESIRRMIGQTNNRANINVKNLPKIYSKTRGVSVDTAADMLGYNSGEELVVAMTKVEDRNDKINRITDDRMLEKFGSLLVDKDAMREQAIYSLHNDKRTQLMLTELKWLVDNKFSAFKKGVKAIAKKVPVIQDVRARAEQIIARQKVRDIKPQAYLAAERRAAKEAMNLFLKGDFEGAFDAKEKELLNHELYKAAVESKEQVDKTLKYMKKFRKESKRQQLGKTDYLEQIDAILHRFEFAIVPEEELSARKKTLAEWLKDTESRGDSAGEEIYAPDILKNEMFRKNYKDMTMEEFIGVRDAVKQIEHMAIQADKSLAQQKAMRRSDMREVLISSIVNNLKARAKTPFTKHGFTAKDKLAAGSREFDASLLKMEQIVDWLDGGEIDGPWRQLLFQPSADAQNNEFDYTAKITAKLAEALNNIPKEIRGQMNDSVAVPGIDRKITRKDLLTVALNLGNESNRSKMMLGMGWTQEQIDFMRDSLSKAEWDFVQSIWDTLESMWPDIAKLQKELTGLEPDRVEITPVQTIHGEYRGGYYPMMYDPIASTTGAIQLSTKIGNLTEDGYARATTPKGHTKSRIAEFSAPINLDLDALPSHIAGVIKDLTHRKFLVDANWIISDRDIRAAISEHLGPEYVTMMQDWLKRVANDKNHSSLASLNIWKRMITHFRYNVMVSAMGFKASTMLSQFAGISMSIDVVGGNDLDGRKYMTSAYASFVRNPMKHYRDIIERSGEMRHRMETKDRDLRGKILELRGRTDFLAKVQEMALWGIGAADLMVSLPTWMAGYQKAIDQGKSESVAIQAGDRAVRLSQGASGAKDMAAVLSRDNDLLRVMTMFYTPFSALYSRMRDVGHNFSEIGAPKAAVRLFWIWIMSSTLGEILAGHGPEDDEDWATWFLRSNAAYPFMAIPGLRDIANSVASEYGYTPTPLVQVGKSTTRVGKTAIKVAQGKKDIGDLAKDTMNASQYWVGLPTKQIEITGGYWVRLMEGKDRPEDLGEFMRKSLFKDKKK